MLSGCVVGVEDVIIIFVIVVIFVIVWRIITLLLRS
jgi:hypothetical protein